MEQKEGVRSVNIELPPQAAAALELLSAAGYEAVVVGGAVRDALRGVPAGDWDIATAARPEETERVFGRWPLVETGRKHGTVTVLLDGLPLEITTYRTEGAYTDHRRPDSVRFTASLTEDLARRDFTVNAMAYCPETGLADPFGGAADLAAGLLRCVGEPERRFREDALRILRGLRFAAALGLEAEPATARALHGCRGLLPAVSAERVQAELTGLLVGPFAGRVLLEYGDVLAAVIPELAPMLGLDQCNPHHDKDLWAHTAAVVDAAPAEPVLRWAALLHDVGKPPCFSLGPDGVGHFYGHAGKSAELADGILARLRLDNARRGRITALIRLHDLPLLPPDRKQVRRLLNRLGPEGAAELIALHRADAAGLAAPYRGRVREYAGVQALLDSLLAERACFSLRDLAVKGDDLLALGLRGRAVGEGLNACLAAVMAEEAPNDRAALLAWLKDR